MPLVTVLPFQGDSRILHMKIMQPFLVDRATTPPANIHSWREENSILQQEKGPLSLEASREQQQAREAPW